MSQTNVINLYERLYCYSDIQKCMDLETKDTCKNNELKDLSITDELEVEIKKFKYSEEKDLDNILNKNANVSDFIKEFESFLRTGKRSKILDLLQEALESIPSTSIEPERIFSIVGLFIHKGRAKLKPEN